MNNDEAYIAGRYGENMILVGGGSFVGMRLK